MLHLFCLLLTKGNELNREIACYMLLDAGVKTNIHYVLGKNIIDEAWADAL